MLNTIKSGTRSASALAAMLGLASSFAMSPVGWHSGHHLRHKRNRNHRRRPQPHDGCRGTHPGHCL
jgi:hypothetical protein